MDVDRVDLVGDELALSGPSTELIFERNRPAPIDGMAGVRWLLEAMVLDGVAASVAGDPATLYPDADGSVTGGTGCRSLHGEYIVSGELVVFPSFGAEGDCPTHLPGNRGLQLL